MVGSAVGGPVGAPEDVVVGDSEGTTEDVGATEIDGACDIGGAVLSASPWPRTSQGASSLLSWCIY